ncbi:hypothetical protein COO60DRAFT_653254 [Scenedesmus sp. NREL 46B-D3]|nr:hypothetical protein COO60DRAFT_653254 [Scenedesmus sp. NREL 46B-D3]
MRGSTMGRIQQSVLDGRRWSAWRCSDQQYGAAGDSSLESLTRLAKDFPNMIAAARQQPSERLGTKTSVRNAANPDTHIELYLQGPGEKEKEIDACKLILQNIMFGANTLLLSILYCTRHYHDAQQHEAAKAAAQVAGQPMPAMSHSLPPVGMPEEDVRTCAQLLVAGQSCLKVASFFGKGKKFCEHFAEIFTVMDPRDFTDVFSVRMGTLFDIMVADADAISGCAPGAERQRGVRVQCAAGKVPDGAQAEAAGRPREQRECAGAAMVRCHGWVSNVCRACVRACVRALRQRCNLQIPHQFSALQQACAGFGTGPGPNSVTQVSAADLFALRHV